MAPSKPSASSRRMYASRLSYRSTPTGRSHIQPGTGKGIGLCTGCRYAITCRIQTFMPPPRVRSWVLVGRADCCLARRGRPPRAEIDELRPIRALGRPPPQLHLLKLLLHPVGLDLAAGAEVGHHVVVVDRRRGRVLVGHLLDH